MCVFTSKRNQISKQFAKAYSNLVFLSSQPKEWSPNVIEDFQSCGDGHSRFYVSTGGSMHLRSEIMQKWRVSTGNGNVEYRYSKLLKVQR